MEVPFEGVVQTVFLIPWEVLQELNILMEHKTPHILQNVKKAVEFLRNTIAAQNSRVVFQLFEEVRVCCGLDASTDAGVCTWSCMHMTVAINGYSH
jgi:hypothetical protein